MLLIVSELCHCADVAAAVTDVNGTNLHEALGYSFGVANFKTPVPLVDWIHAFLLYWRVDLAGGKSLCLIPNQSFTTKTKVV